MKRLIITLSVALAACGGGGNDPSQVEPQASAVTPAPVVSTPAPVAAPTVTYRHTIDMQGDSTTWGSDGVTQVGSEPQHLRDLLPADIRVINNGVRGATILTLLGGFSEPPYDTAGGTIPAHTQLPWNLYLATSPADIVTLNFGMNDANIIQPASGPRVALTDYGTNVRVAIDAARAYGKTVILQEPNPSCDPHIGNLILYVDELNRIAVEKNVRIVHQYRNAPANWRDMVADCVHPNSAYYKIKAQATYDVIKDLI